MPIRAISTSGSTIFDKSREGMARGERRLAKAANAISKGDVSAEPIVDLVVAKTMYTANAKVVQTQDAMLGSLLDVRR